MRRHNPSVVAWHAALAMSHHQRVRLKLRGGGRVHRGRIVRRYVDGRDPDSVGRGGSTVIFVLDSGRELKASAIERITP